MLHAAWDRMMALMDLYAEIAVFRLFCLDLELVIDPVLYFIWKSKFVMKKA
jgi:hypothetical protein